MNLTNFKCECGRCFEIKKSLGNHRAKCETYKTHLDNLLTIDFYNYHYFELDKSLKIISTELDLSKQVVSKHLKNLGLTKKTLSEQRNSSCTKNKKRDTNLKKYGKEKFTNRPKSNQTHIDRYGGVGFQVKELADKTKATLLERYGVDNCAKSEIVQENRKNTCLDKYGYITNLIHPDYITRINETKRKNGSFLTGYSKSSQELFWSIYFNLTQKNNIYFGQLNKEFESYNTQNRIQYYFDFTDNTTKRVIEYNGNLFHANPSMYKENDTPNPFDRNKTAKEIWEYDTIRLNFIKSLGYDVLIVWEHEYLNNKSATIDLCVEFLTKN